jgi:hypothetical protein
MTFKAMDAESFLACPDGCPDLRLEPTQSQRQTNGPPAM